MCWLGSFSLSCCWVAFEDSKSLKRPSKQLGCGCVAFDFEYVIVCTERPAICSPFPGYAAGRAKNVNMGIFCKMNQTSMFSMNIKSKPFLGPTACWMADRFTRLLHLPTSTALSSTPHFIKQRFTLEPT